MASKRDCCRYEFVDEYDSFTVYKHHDGYPKSKYGAYGHIQKSITFAWPIPRFEACDFSAAFVAGNKSQASGGGVYLTKDRYSHADTQYHYVISLKNKTLYVVRWEPSRGDWEVAESGTLEDMLKKYCSE